MYGLVNKAIKELIVAKFGEEKWTEISASASAPSDFVSMEYYEDTLTYGLVGAAARILNSTPEALLKAFGNHWILYTASEGYGPLMDLFGSDLKTCLLNLNNLHGRMGMTMPKLAPPRFVVVEKSPQIFEIEYHSTRKGLGPMVEGLFEGLAARYKTNASVTRIDNGAEIPRFRVEILQAA